MRNPAVSNMIALFTEAEQRHELEGMTGYEIQLLNERLAFHRHHWMVTVAAESGQQFAESHQQPLPQYGQQMHLMEPRGPLNQPGRTPMAAPIMPQAHRIRQDSNVSMVSRPANDQQLVRRGSVHVQPGKALSFRPQNFTYLTFRVVKFKATVAFSILGVKSPPPAIRTKVIPKVLTMKMELCDHEVSQTLLKIVVAEISPTTLSRVLIGDTHQIHKEEIHLEIPPLEDRSTSATYHLHMMALFQLATESFRHQLQAIHSTLQTVASVVVVLELRPQQTMCRTFTILRP